MSKKGDKAEQYANAALQALIERWQALFSQVFDRLDNDKQTYSYLMDSSLPFDERESALVDALPNDAPPEFVNLLKLMMQNEDLDILREMSGALTQVSSSAKQPTRVGVVSAFELTDEQKEEMRQSLTKQYGSELIFTFDVDPSLMGGLRVRIGDKLIDTSVSSRLAALRETVKNAVR